jgi:antirestriction protein ArdC
VERRRARRAHPESLRCVDHPRAGDRAFYRPATDSIHLPDRGQFPTADNYYATALHELGHWTGHESRLDRDLVHPSAARGTPRKSCAPRSLP